jgi:hypothetical protein
LDWELERRGHRFVRYADDCNILVRSARAGQRVIASIRNFLEQRMRLKVNEEKSGVRQPHEVHFLGFRCKVDRDRLGVAGLRNERRLKMDEPSVKAIIATIGGPSTFVIAPRDSPDRERVVSSSLLIQNALLPALLSGAKPVRLDLVPGTTVIRRVQFFALGTDPLRFDLFSGDHIVSRIATPPVVKADQADHLEVALKKIGDTEETAFNIFDPFLQQILIAAFRLPGPPFPPGQSLPVDVQFDEDEIVTVTLGENVRS